ncbi:MAG TPA: NAD(P)/FAD-dependent oxidoreductase [Frankiaceae bacterium]|nr:NAD(P)/FAD-dependent oxidoreductase [Frankiaceae bacterium]
MSKPRIAIIGAGPGGLCMAIKLKAAGYDDFVILERSGGVGGTWYQNRYPGCACDIQSHLYSYSFEIKPDWTRPYATQPEILAYMEFCAQKYGILPHCRFGSEVVRATWSESSSSWTVELRSGELVEADGVVSALGMFNDLDWPDIEGLNSFEGTRFHSARWDWDHDLTGESVGVIGSAASAVQFVPEIIKQAGQVHLFQRTANWVLPKLDDPASPAEIEARLRDPNLALAIRQQIFDAVDSGQTFSNLDLNAEREAGVLAAIQVVEDPAVRAKLVPTHPYGCKRPLVSNNYYAAFNEPNLELVTDPITRVTKDGIVTVDGRERRVDTLVIATGFAATRYLSAIDVVGRAGRHISDAWNDGAIAYLGITTAGFPNLFMLYGPNTNNGSILAMIEYQVEHVMRLLDRLASEELAWLDVRPDVMHSYNEEVQKAIAGVQVWQAGCNGYYRTPSGRVVTQWPYSMTEFRERSSAIDPNAFEVSAR